MKQTIVISKVLFVSIHQIVIYIVMLIFQQLLGLIFIFISWIRKEGAEKRRKNQLHPLIQAWPLLLTELISLCSTSELLDHGCLLPLQSQGACGRPVTHPARRPPFWHPCFRCCWTEIPSPSHQWGAVRKSFVESHAYYNPYCKEGTAEKESHSSIELLYTPSYYPYCFF